MHTEKKGENAVEKKEEEGKKKKRKRREKASFFLPTGYGGHNSLELAPPSTGLWLLTFLPGAAASAAAGEGLFLESWARRFQ